MKNDTNYENEEVLIPEEYTGIENTELKSCIVLVEDGMKRLTSFSGNLVNACEMITKLQYDIKVMDNQLDNYIATLQYDLEQFNKIAPIVEKQLQSISSRMDLVLARLMQSDFSSLDQADVEMRQQLIQLLSDQNDSFCDMSIKLMTR